MAGVPEEEIKKIRESSKQLKMFVTALAQKTAETLFKQIINSISHSPVGNMEDEATNKIPGYAISEVENTAWHIQNDFIKLFMSEYQNAMYALSMHNLLMANGIDSTKIDGDVALDMFKKLHRGYNK